MGFRMTLAAVILVVIFSAPSAQPLVARDSIASQTTPATQNPLPSSANSTMASPPQTPTAPKPHRKKRGHPANCGAMPTGAAPAAANASGASGSTPASADPGAPTTPSPAPAAASASTNCPPKKVIVRHGGTSEPSIQLAGGPGPATTSNQRDPATQMLDTTEANLKKLAGKQLTANQQDMVSQTRQFMQQSKDAVGAGDLERARTLAWKAQVLSEELVKPEK